MTNWYFHELICLNFTITEYKLIGRWVIKEVIKLKLFQYVAPLSTDSLIRRHQDSLRGTGKSLTESRVC